MSYKKDFAANNTEIENNNTDLDSLIEQANALPDAGGAKYIEVTLGKSSVPYGYIDENGDMQLLTATEATTVKAWNGVISIRTGIVMEVTGDYIEMINTYVFKSDGGMINYD